MIFSTRAHSFCRTQPQKIETIYQRLWGDADYLGWFGVVFCLGQLYAQLEPMLEKQKIHLYDANAIAHELIFLAHIAHERHAMDGRAH